MKTLHIIACSATKNWMLEHRGLPARNAYAGPAFLAAREYLESMGYDWVILSAYYGIVRPQEVIWNYDARLDEDPNEMHAALLLQKMSQATREILTARAFERVVCLAGKDYCQVAGFMFKLPVETPLKGMGIGKQIHALKYGTWDENSPKVTT